MLYVENMDDYEWNIFFLVDNDKKVWYCKKKKKYDNVYVKFGLFLKKVKNIKFEWLFDGFELLFNNIYCNDIVCSLVYIYFIGICIWKILKEMCNCW